MKRILLLMLIASLSFATSGAQTDSSKRKPKKPTTHQVTPKKTPKKQTTPKKQSTRQSVERNGNSNSLATLDEGFYYYDKKEYDKAFPILLKYAKKGDAKAQHYLGYCYYDGHGVQKDYSKAVEWYTKAAEQGFADAQYDLGFCYANGDGVQKD